MNERPKLTDPNEFALIKSIYFKDSRPVGDDLDPVERLDRMESKQRFNNKSSR